MLVVPWLLRMLKAGLECARKKMPEEEAGRVAEFDRQLKHGSPEAGAEAVTSNFVVAQKSEKASMLTALG